MFVATVLPWASASFSQDADPRSVFSFSGFGTLGVAHSSEDQADFIASPLQESGAGYSHDWAANIDSRFGAQINADFGRLSAVMQGISEQKSDGSFSPRFEWLNIRYAITPDLSIRAGRIVLPSFLVSDYRKVGYANPWVRPPIELYSLVPVSTSDGVDASYRFELGEWTHTVQINFGDADGVVDTVEWNDLILRFSYQQSDLDFDAFTPFLSRFRAFGAQGAALAEKYDPDGKTIHFVGVGVSYDPGGWFLMGEWGRHDSDSIIGKREAWYVSGGYRWSKFTPYFVYAETEMRSRMKEPGIGLSSVPPGQQGQAAGLNAALNGILAARQQQRSIAIGLRWDFAEKAAFKLQYDHIRLEDDSWGALTNVQPEFRPGGSFNVFSATIDFVF